MSYNTGVNHIKNDRMLEASCRPFSTRERGTDTMTHSIPNSTDQSNIPYGYCHCGCGQKTTIAKLTNARYGHVKGQPVRFVIGHHNFEQRAPVNNLILQPGTRAIPLTQGKIAIVDDADYEYLNQFRWFASKDKNTWYAMRTVPRSNGKETKVSMHRDLLGVLSDAHVDHVDMNGLNNTRGNIRPCTGVENRRNRGAQRNNTSGFKGVTWHKASNKWRAQIRQDGTRKHLGLFDSPEDAARAYDTAARELHGSFARPNFATQAPREESRA